MAHPATNEQAAMVMIATCFTGMLQVGVAAYNDTGREWLPEPCNRQAAIDEKTLRDSGRDGRPLKTAGAAVLTAGLSTQISIIGSGIGRSNRKGGPMIDIVVTQRIKPGMEAHAEALFREVEAATLAHDQGCMRYEWYRAEEAGTYILIERWSDHAAIQAHFKSPHMAALLPKLAPYAVEKFTSVRLSRLS